MKKNYMKYDSINLTHEQIGKLQSSSTSTVTEMLKNISIPQLVVHSDDGVYYAFTNTDSGLVIEHGNSNEVHFAYAIDFKNGRIGFIPIYVDQNYFSFMCSTFSFSDYQNYLKEILGLYAVLNDISLNRPSILTAGEIQITVPKTIKKNGRYKDVMTSVMVKRYQLNDKELPNRHNNIVCPCWGVAGHYRHYKNGKVVFIESYRKGKKRNEPEAYQPKNYKLPR